MPDRRQSAREEVLERDELLVVLDDGVGALFPRQADVRAETAFRARALVACLHDPRASPRDDHPARVRDAPRKFNSLLIFLLGRSCPGGAENSDFAGAGPGREQFERVPQFPERRGDDPDVAPSFNIAQQSQPLFDDVGYQILVMSPAFERDQLVDPVPQFQFRWRPIVSIHIAKLSATCAKAIESAITRLPGRWAFGHSTMRPHHLMAESN